MGFCHGSTCLSSTLATRVWLGILSLDARRKRREVAVALAQDRGRIRRSKRGIRSRFLRSKPGDGEAFTRGFESALRDLSARRP